MEITNYNEEYRHEVSDLWREVFGYQESRNVPEVVIDKKVSWDDGLFFVAVVGGHVIGAIMAGYDGHRGWIYSLAVHPRHRGKGIGTALLKHAEKCLKALGYMKINLQILEKNMEVEDFYLANGYSTEKRISMGKCIDENIPKTKPYHVPDDLSTCTS